MRLSCAFYEAGDSCKPFITPMKRKKSPPPFLRGRKISNQAFTRHDAVGLAEDSLVLNVVYPDIEKFEPILISLEWMKDKTTSHNDKKLGNDPSCS